jgi:Immunoglobulin domain
VRVAAAKAFVGPDDVYVKRGSTISLTCQVNIHSNPAPSVLWYHGSSTVDFDSPRGGISLETEKTEVGTTSKLLITKARLSDSGNYTCVPSSAEAASVQVHVLNGQSFKYMFSIDKLHGHVFRLRVKNSDMFGGFG